MDKYRASTEKPDCEPGRPIKRREFLKQVGCATSAVPITSALAGGLAGTALTSVAAEPPAAPNSPMPGYICLSQAEAAFVETMVTIMCPTDQFTPNGVDCGLAVFIDRQLGGDFGQGAKHYQRGPWQPGPPQLGYQLPLTPQQYFKVGVEAANDACVRRFGKPFDQIAPAQADAFLHDLADNRIGDEPVPLGTWFNELIYPLFTQACFADPIYGGNSGKVFWKMIGYPGLPANNTNNMVQYRGKPFPGALDPKSIVDFS